MLKNVPTPLELFVFLIFFLREILVKSAGFCDVFWFQQNSIPAEIFSWWMEKSRTSRAPHAEDVIPEEEHSLTRGEERSNTPSVWGQEGEGGRRGGDKDASFPALRAAGQECKSKCKPGECCARSREFGVPLSRSFQYMRELPNGMCGIHVIYLMHENWFLLSLPWCLRQKYFWFPTWCSHHQTTAVLLKPGHNGSSGQPPASGQAEAGGTHRERRGSAAFDPAFSLCGGRTWCCLHFSLGWTSKSDDRNEPFPLDTGQKTFFFLSFPLLILS